MSKLLSVKNLKIMFERDSNNTYAVQDLSFDILEGETLAIVGESGSGKSVSALACLGLLTDNAVVKGSIRWNSCTQKNRNIPELSQIRGSQAGIIFQEPMTSLNPLHTIEKQVGEAIQIHQNLEKARLRRRTLDLLDKVGIPYAENRLGSYPHQLSGGQRQRVMIAMALANYPKLLIADEPTTALDVTIEAQIIDLLHELQRETGMAMLFISHDLGLVKQLADRVIVMKEGKVIEQGSKKQIFNKPREDYTRSLVDAKSDKRREKLDKTKNIVLEAQNVTVKFPIKKGFLQRISDFVPAVLDVSFQLHSGESLGIVGESGSGKSSLARALTKLVPHNGNIYFKNNCLAITYY